MKLPTKILMLAAIAGMLFAQDSQTFRCSIDGRDEVIPGHSAINFPSCGDIVCNHHVKWVRVGERRWWKILIGAGKLVAVCPIHGVQ